MDAGCWNFDGATQRPSQFSLMREPQQPVAKTEQPEGGILYDFGKETFGFITLKNLSGKGKIDLYYGEVRKKRKTKHIAKHWINSCWSRDRSLISLSAAHLLCIILIMNIRWRTAKHSAMYTSLTNRKYRLVKYLCNMNIFRRISW